MHPAVRRLRVHHQVVAAHLGVMEVLVVLVAV
jgi:hypothetical protein